MSEVITSGKIIQKQEVVLEVDDFLPPGIAGVRSKTNEEVRLQEGAGSESVGTLIEADDMINSEDVESDWLYDRLPVPSNMTIVSQTVRIGADRKMVVDVVIETNDFPGVSEFESRIIRDKIKS